MGNQAGALGQLLAAGADLEARANHSSTGVSTPLVMAAQAGAQEAVEALLAAGAGGQASCAAAAGLWLLARRPLQRSI